MYFWIECSTHTWGLNVFSSTNYFNKIESYKWDYFGGGLKCMYQNKLFDLFFVSEKEMGLAVNSWEYFLLFYFFDILNLRLWLMTYLTWVVQKC